MMPRQPIPGGSGRMGALPKSINPNSPVTSMPRFTGQTTKAGKPIVETRLGKRYVIPQKGISTSLRSQLLGTTNLKSGSVSANVPQKIKNISIKKQLAATHTKWGPHSETIGPLGNPNDPKSVASTFRSGTYTEKVLRRDIILYRVYGGEAKAEGRYWTRIRPEGKLQSDHDSAILPEFKNTGDKLVIIRIPAGTKVYEGYAASQQSNLGSRAQFFGGGNQVYVPQVESKWIVQQKTL
jgi:hypothetical protein